MRNGKPATPADFWARTKPVKDCIEWQGMTEYEGYGLVRYHMKMWRAHRLAWFLTFGTINAKLPVCHTCDNPRCVRPSHLYQATQKQNILDKVNKGRQATGEKHGASKLTEDDVRSIRELRELGVSVHVLTQIHGVSDPTIRAVCDRRTWRHVC